MTEDLSFSTQLSALLARETLVAMRDPARMAAMIELLAAGLGLAVSLAAEGNGPLIDRLMQGAEAHAHAQAVDRAPLARRTADTIRRMPQ